MRQECSDIDKYLDGHSLYGDDFDLSEIKKWYQEEKEGYADLGAKESTGYRYVYHKLNKYYGFQNLDSGLQDLDVLSFGGAYGHELLPIIDKVRSITIIEPSIQMRGSHLRHIPIDYVDPNITGKIDLDKKFDLITCFGVLHHIPNISFVVSELHSLLKDEGILLLREPIVSMGDWRTRRKGLTKNERGIPLNILRKILKNFKIIDENICLSTPFDRLYKIALGKSKYDSELYLLIDKWISKLTIYNYHYHARYFWQKVRPTSAFYVLRLK